LAWRGPADPKPSSYVRLLAWRTPRPAKCECTLAFAVHFAVQPVLACSLRMCKAARGGIFPADHQANYSCAHSCKLQRVALVGQLKALSSLSWQRLTRLDRFSYGLVRFIGDWQQHHCGKWDHQRKNRRR
jgi:hypothetical protein